MFDRLKALRLIFAFILAFGYERLEAETLTETDRLSAEMDRLARAAIKSQETGTCNIHHVHMQKKMVPIYFGGPAAFDSPFYYATMRYFPNAREYINGGCEIDERLSDKKKPRYVCPACKRAEHAWALKHANDDDAKWILSRQKP